MKENMIILEMWREIIRNNCRSIHSMKYTCVCVKSVAEEYKQSTASTGIHDEIEGKVFFLSREKRGRGCIENKKRRKRRRRRKERA